MPRSSPRDCSVARTRIHAFSLLRRQFFSPMGRLASFSGSRSGALPRQVLQRLRCRSDYRPPGRAAAALTFSQPTAAVISSKVTSAIS
ncbi:hypothetical protein KCP73_05955 [Salmonella enterica subsp. enterica]|nr:hypothetical protein KCP73_05955 [Salmonella enterica subsp. enterica]